MGTPLMGAENKPNPSPKSTENREKPTSAMNLGIHASFDCLHDFNLDKGASQSCIGLSSLSILGERQIERIYGRVAINPFNSPVGAFENRPILDSRPGIEDQSVGIIEDYKIAWSPRSQLEIAIESFRGSALYPTENPLALSNPFMESGWKQTALTVTYNLLALPEMHVRFAAGNGEGENGKNLDTQQFFGFDIGASPIRGIKTHLGISLDGNSAGSEEARWKLKKFANECDPSSSLSPLPYDAAGYSTQRMSLGLVVDGVWPGTEGLQLGLGYQRNVYSDLAKKQASQLSLSDLKKCPRIDVTSFFIEDQDGLTVNTVQKTVFNVDLIYKSGSDYFLALNYSKRDVDSGSVKTFSPCSEFAESQCTKTTNDPVNNFGTDSLTAGLGLFLSNNSSVSVEYQLQTIDKLYDLANFSDRKGTISKTRDVVDARFAVSLR